MFTQIKQKISQLSNLNIGTENIVEAKFIHETRWYMEERETLYTKKFKI